LATCCTHPSQHAPEVLYDAKHLNQGTRSLSTAQREFRTGISKSKAASHTRHECDEDGGLRPGYKLKLNSYDLGVDIELHNALQRIRFEHPRSHASSSQVQKDRMFCAGANIYMLAGSSHAGK